MKKKVIPIQVRRRHETQQLDIASLLSLLSATLPQDRYALHSLQQSMQDLDRFYQFLQEKGIVK